MGPQSGKPIGSREREGFKGGRATYHLRRHLEDKSGHLVRQEVSPRHPAVSASHNQHVPVHDRGHMGVAASRLGLSLGFVF